MSHSSSPLQGGGVLRPVFIIGCPRSGTTLTLDLVAAHEAFAWVSGFVNKWPEHLALSALNRVYEAPGLGRRLYHHRISPAVSGASAALLKALPRPAEPWTFWQAYLSNFQWPRGGSTPPRRTTAADISKEEIVRIREAVRAICAYQGKGRFLSKYTDFPRIAYLREAFPDALFLHVVRDGRAVAYSYYEQIANGRFNTWEERSWWIRGWPAAWREDWLAGDQDPLRFVAYQWKFFVREIREDAKLLGPGAYLEVRYRDLVGTPGETLAKVFAFCGLPPSPRVTWLIDRLPFGDMNSKWRRELTPEQQEMLNAVVQEPEYRQYLDE